MRDEYGKRLFFTDQRKELYGLLVEGIPVLNLDEAANLYGHAGLFIVSVFNRETACSYPDIVATLKHKGTACHGLSLHGIWGAFTSPFLP